MAPPPRQAVKITNDTHAQLRELCAHAARNGWKSMGVDRDDLPTQAAMIEEAVRYFANATMKPRGGKR